MKYKNRDNFIKFCFCENLQSHYQKMIKYYEVIDGDDVNIPAFIKAKKDIIDRYKRGGFDEIGRLKNETR